MKPKKSKLFKQPLSKSPFNLIQNNPTNQFLSMGSLPIPKIQTPNNLNEEQMEFGYEDEPGLKKFSICLDNLDREENQNFEESGLLFDDEIESNIPILEMNDENNESSSELQKLLTQQENDGLNETSLCREYYFDDWTFYEEENKNIQEYWFESEHEIQSVSSNSESEEPAPYYRRNLIENEKRNNTETDEKDSFEDFDINFENDNVSSECSDYELNWKELDKEAHKKSHFKIEIKNIDTDCFYDSDIASGETLFSITSPSEKSQSSSSSESSSSISESAESSSEDVESTIEKPKENDHSFYSEGAKSGNKIERVIKLAENRNVVKKRNIERKEKVIKNKKEAKSEKRSEKERSVEEQKVREDKKVCESLKDKNKHNPKDKKVLNLEKSNDKPLFPTSFLDKLIKYKTPSSSEHLKTIPKIQVPNHQQIENKNVQNKNETKLSVEKIKSIKNNPKSKESLIGDEIITLFKRPERLQDILENYSLQRSEIVSSVLFNNLYFQNLNIKIPLPPKIPLSFASAEEYQRIILANQKNELYNSTRETLKRVNENISYSEQSKLTGKQNESLLFKIHIEQQRKNDRSLMYELSATVVQEQNWCGNSENNEKAKNFNNNANHLISSRNYRSKYRLFAFKLLNKENKDCFVICQIKDIRKIVNNQKEKEHKQIQLKIMTGIDLNSILNSEPNLNNSFNSSNNQNRNKNNHFSNINIFGYFYDLEKVSTQSREYDSVTNIKYSALAPLIITPAQTKLVPIAPINSILEQFNNEIRQNLSRLHHELQFVYNSSQLNAIKSISTSFMGIDLLQGPPGTGKTSTLIGILSCEYLKIESFNKILAIRQKEKNESSVNKKSNFGFAHRPPSEMVGNMSNSDSKANTSNQNYDKEKGKKNSWDKNILKILICTPSNAAINLITTKILTEGLFSLDKQNLTEISKFRSPTNNENWKSSEEINLYKKFPRILRIGVQEEESSNEISNMRKKDSEDLLGKFTGFHNYSLFRILNSLFENEIRMHSFSITKQEILNKVNDILNQIAFIKSHFSEEDGKVEERLGEVAAKTSNWENLMNNTISIKNTIIESMQDFVSKPAQPIKNQPHSSEVYILKELMKQIETHLIAESEVILTTLASSFSEKIALANPKFTCVIVDEAGQSLEGTSLIPLQYGMNKAIMIGDQCQLPPTINNVELFKTFFNRSLFERLWSNASSSSSEEIESSTNNCLQTRTFILSIQYRMNPLIREFPSKAFYNDKLLDSDSVISRSLNSNYSEKFGMTLKEVTFIDCQKGIEEMSGSSFFNRIEGQLIVGIVCKIHENWMQRYVEFDERLSKNITIGVITPYAEQQKFIKKNLELRIDQLINQLKFQTNIQQLPQVTVSTVDSYQGQERDIIIISTVRSNNKGNVGFLQDYRRINVALTRAKESLIVVGNERTLGNNSIWDKFLNWAKEKGTYLSCQSEDMNKNNNMKGFLSAIFIKNQTINQTISLPSVKNNIQKDSNNKKNSSQPQQTFLQRSAHILPSLRNNFTAIERSGKDNSCAGDNDCSLENDEKRIETIDEKKGDWHVRKEWNKEESLSNGSKNINVEY